MSPAKAGSSSSGRVASSPVSRRAVAPQYHEGGKTRVRAKQSSGAQTPGKFTASRPSNKVNVFISYANSDHLVAKALYEELIDINRDRINCFLDTKTIESGEGWEQKLESALGQADWLVCVYTGEQSEFCGYEIGVFTRGKALEKTEGNSRLVCLHDVPSYPTVFQRHQNRLVELPPEYLAPGHTFDETEFYAKSAIAQFIADFCNYQDLYVPRDASGYQRQAQMIVSKSKLITEAFRASRGTDIRADTPTQLGVEVTLPWPSGKPLPAIPPDAQVKGTFQSFSLFGLMPHMEGGQLPIAPWADIKAAGRGSGSGYLPWIERLERDMVDAANKRALGDAEATFRSKDKTFRAILVRHLLQWNGTHRFGVVFVETLPRQFIGDQNTSLILAGLVIASRFRFAYFENPEATERRFADNLPDQDFEASYRQFLYDLERMRQESMELGLLDEASFVQSFGPDRRGIAETFLKVWWQARQALERDLPAANESIGPANRHIAKGAIMAFLKTMEAENSKFLLTAMDAYRDEVTARLHVRVTRREN